MGGNAEARTPFVAIPTPDACAGVSRCRCGWLAVRYLLGCPYVLASWVGVCLCVCGQERLALTRNWWRTRVDNNANLHGYNCHCCDWCIGNNCASLVGTIYFTRIETQKLYGMPEDHCAACCTTCCCAPCVICQEAREIKYRTGRSWC